MGLLDSLLGSMSGSLPSNQQPTLFNMVFSLIQSHPGGLQGLIDQFMQSGLGQHAQSWVGTGQNMPISAEQLIQTLGSGRLQELAQQFGIPANTAAGGLAAILPQIIDHLTPNGQVPSPTQVNQRLDALKSGV